MDPIKNELVHDLFELDLPPHLFSCLKEGNLQGSFGALAGLVLRPAGAEEPDPV